MASNTWRGAALVAAACAWAFAPSRDVRACGNEVERRVDPRVEAVAAAERLVADGKAAAAAKKVLTIDPAATKRAIGGEPLADRELVVLARAAVRSQGRVYHGHAGADPTLEERAQAVRWATQVFKEVRKRRGDDPAVLTDLAEAQSYLPELRHEALAVLISLERRDVVATAQGYAALASLRLEQAKASSAQRKAPLALMGRYTRELELTRCKQMAKDATVCDRAAELGS